MICKNKI